MASYESLSQLSGVYLEDSYVLDIITDEHSVTFDIDVVLTAEHPAYTEPPPNEQYCFRRGRIVISRADSVRWIRRVMQPFRDLNGEVDYGAIDRWSIDEGVSLIEGDWGKLELRGGEVSLILEASHSRRRRS